MTRCLHGVSRDRHKFDWDKAARDYRAGWTVEEVAEIHGVTHGSVWWALKRLGVPTRKTGSRRHPRVDDYVFFWECGCSLREIARAYRVTPAAVQLALRRREAVAPQRIPADLDDEAVEVFVDAYALPWQHTVAGALALAYEDMAERGVRRARA
jgi:hypothetical protein